MITNDKLLCNQLTNYVFNNVWNHFNLEHRQNFILRVESKVNAVYNQFGNLLTDAFAKTASSAIYFGDNRITLPTNVPYYIYTIPKGCIGGLRLNCPAWITLDKYLNTKPFDLRIHGHNGKWLWRKALYIKDHPFENSLILAVEATMAKSILGQDYNFLKLFLSVYLDPTFYSRDNGSVITIDPCPIVHCYRPIDLAERNSAYSDITTNPDKKYVFLNGNEARITSVDDIKNGDYIEVVYDPDILCKLSFDLTKPEENNQYRSSLHTVYKQLIHIPKMYNPQNHIITHNTCDIFMRPVNQPNARLRGRFVHRFNLNDKLQIYGASNEDINGVYHIKDSTKVFTKRQWTKGIYEIRYDIELDRWIVRDNVSTTMLSQQLGSYTDPYVDTVGWTNDVNIREYDDEMITQVTHNDFAISDVLIQAYKGVLSCDEIEIMVVVRKTRRPKVNIKDVNFINYLYQLNDNQITNIMTGYGDPRVNFWKAENLEKSMYPKMMIDVPDFVTENNIKDYINTLGYYNTVNILSNRMHKFRIVDNLIIKSFTNHLLNGTYVNNSNTTSGTDRIWTKDTYSIKYSVNKWKLYKNSTVVASQLIGATQPHLDNWTTEIIDTEPISTADINLFVNENNTRVFGISNLGAFASSEKVAALVYMNGLKIPGHLCTTTKSGDQATVKIDPSYEIPHIGEVTVELFNNEPRRSIIITPTRNTLNNCFGRNLTIDKDLAYEDITFKVRSSIPESIQPSVLSSITNFTNSYTNVENKALYFPFPSYPGSNEYNIHLDNIGSTGYNYIVTKDVYGKTIIKFGQHAWTKNIIIELNKHAHFTEYQQTFDLVDMNNDALLVGPINYNSELIQNTYPVLTDNNKDKSLIVDEEGSIVFLNGRELIEGLDYRVLQLTTTVNSNVYPYCKAIMLYNVSYLKETDNLVEVIFISDKTLTKKKGFVHNSTILDIDSVVNYHPSISTITQDGYRVRDINSESWNLQLLQPNIRQGAIYNLRSVVPIQTQVFIDKYISEMDIETLSNNDIEKLNSIAEYFRYLQQQEDPIFVIERSHMVYSLLLNQIIKDVLDGTLTLGYSENRDIMLGQIQQYLPLKPYDQAIMNGISTSIVVNNSQFDMLNDLYYINDITFKGNARTWTNPYTNMIIGYNPVLKRWELKTNTTVNTTLYYYSEIDETGSFDPWTLNWMNNQLNDTSIPSISCGDVDLRYVDLLPSYRLNEAYESNTYVCLIQLIKFLFSSDAIKDGVTVNLLI